MAVAKGLEPLRAVEPMSAVEWADQYFYLSPESSYIEGPWTTAPFQVFILNVMGNDNIRQVFVQKSARCGYTKCMVAALLYMVEHKKRNTLVYQPTDDDAGDFVKDELDPALRDCRVIHPIFPGQGKKGEGNTEDKKQFIGSTMDIKGGVSPGNYRRMSKDVVAMDEADGFPWVVKPDGDPKMLAKKRLVGSSFPKFIAGTTPVDKGRSHIELLMKSADVAMRFHVPCPHCGEEQYLKWGGKDCDHGIKWQGDDPNTAEYLCEHCHTLFDYSQLAEIQRKGRWICDKTGIWSKDGLSWFSLRNAAVVAPKKVGIYIWAAYSLTSSWSELVDRFLEARGDPDTLKTFVNTDLGELWEDQSAPQLDWEILYNRREMYHHQVPDRCHWLMGAVDTQDNRLEFYVWGFGVGNEKWLIWKQVLMGDPSQTQIWREADKILPKRFKTSSGAELGVLLWAWDTGGHYGDEVHKASVRNGNTWVIPIKGASNYAAPEVKMPLSTGDHGTYLTQIGTNVIKTLMYQRLQIPLGKADEACAGFIHLPLNDGVCDESVCQQLTAEQKLPRLVNGKTTFLWDNGKRRNEAWDCLVYAYAMFLLAQMRFGLDISSPPETAAKVAPDKKSGKKRKGPRVQGGVR